MPQCSLACAGRIFITENCPIAAVHLSSFAFFYLVTLIIHFLLPDTDKQQFTEQFALSVTSLQQ